MNSFFNGQFNYCSLLGMLHSRFSNKKVKHVHERCLRLIHYTKLSSYNDLFTRDKSASTHYKIISNFGITKLSQTLI